MAMAGLSRECCVRQYDVAASELLDPNFSQAFRLMEGSNMAASGTKRLVREQPIATKSNQYIFSYKHDLEVQL